jgi:predicted nucleic acid-binding Zn ribbon protein
MLPALAMELSLSMSRIAILANAILDRNALDTPAVDLGRCFVCARTFSAGKGVGLNGRFCSKLCLEAYDGGYVHRDAGAQYKLQVRGDGSLIDCPGCKRPFISKGLRVCSDACEHRLKEQATIAAVMAEVGMEAGPKRSFTCQHCGKSFPRWRNGKTVPKGTRFCSDSCGAKARRKAARKAPFGQSEPNRPHVAQNRSEVPVSQQAPTWSEFPLNLVGGRIG